MTQVQVRKQTEAKRKEITRATADYLARKYCYSTLESLKEKVGETIVLTDARQLLGELSSLGVVIAVEGKLPESPENISYHLGYKQTVPLVEENSSG